MLGAISARVFVRVFALVAMTWSGEARGWRAAERYPCSVAEQLGLFARPVGGPRGEVRIARGAREAEGELLARLLELVEEARREPERLARPARVVVPSRSLRRHVAAVVAERLGAASAGVSGVGGVAGVTVQTLHGLACEVLERAGEPAPRGRQLFGLVAARLARSEAALRRGLEGLADGFGVVAGTVRDLLDAGLEPAHAEAAAELLASDGRRAAAGVQVERALALVRVAARLAPALGELGIAAPGEPLGRAAALLAGAAGDSWALDALLPARAVLVHGFADATGVASDLIEALLRHRGACLVLDWPPRPAGAGAVESAFTGRLVERLAGFTQAPARRRGAAEPLLEGFHAVGADGEMRELAQRVGALLAAGARPEGIGVVARDFDPYRLALRRHFRRLGVPFSALGERGPLAPAGRLASALLDLLRRGDEMPADRFLDLVESLPAGPRIDLRLAFFALGAGRLRDLAELDPSRFAAGFALPIRVGLGSTAAPGGSPAGWDHPARGSEGGDGGEGGVDGAGAGDGDGNGAGGDTPGEAATGSSSGHDGRRRVAGERIAEARRVAAQVRARLASWPELAPAATRLREVAALFEVDLGWRRDGERGAPVLVALAALAAELPAALALRLDELHLLLAAALADAATVELGGRGGGVQVLTAMEARGRTFDHLFVIGLNRDLFPRPVREDALLPDSLRLVLRRVLPDVPLKRGGFDEERYLFAQLLSAAPAVALSWRSADEEGRPLPPSPLVERLGSALAAVRAPALYAAPSGGSAGPGAARLLAAPRPADEEAVLAALHAPRSHFAEVLPAACREVRGELPGTDLQPAPDELAMTPGEQPRTDLLPAPTQPAGSRRSVLRPLLVPPPEELAAARLRILDEMDPDPRSAAGRGTARRLGPYFGFIGPLAGTADGDPRRRDLYVTWLEGLAGCPWQLFVTRLLRVQPTPDPLGALPGLDQLLLGNLVHAALDRIVAARMRAAREPGPAGAGGEAGDPHGGAPPAPAALRPVPVPWPADGALDRLLHAEAERLLADQGMALPGLVRALAARARPYLAAARQADWEPAAGLLPVLASEAERQVEVRDGAGRPRPLRFRADRLDLAGGAPRWTDYKIGRPFSTARKAEARRRGLLQRVRAGVSLQGVAYTRASAGAVGTGVGEEGARPAPGAGRYLFLGPDLGGDEREYLVLAGDEELDSAFDAASRAVLSAWDEGSFFPRLLDAGGHAEPARCSWCTVAEACLRGDPGSRHRLLDWTKRTAAAGKGRPAGAGEREEPAGAGGEPGGPAGAGGAPADPAGAGTGPEGPAGAALLSLWRLGQA